MNRRKELIAAMERAIQHDAKEGPPFEWGKRDCLLYCADIVRDAIGVDPAEPFRGRYNDPESAARTVGLKGLLWSTRQRAREIGARRVKVSDAKPGDWGVCNIRPGVSLLKYRGDYWLSCEDGGHTLVPSRYVAAAWSFCE